MVIIFLFIDQSSLPSNMNNKFHSGVVKFWVAFIMCHSPSYCAIILKILANAFLQCSYSVFEKLLCILESSSDEETARLFPSRIRGRGRGTAFRARSWSKHRQPQLGTSIFSTVSQCKYLLSFHKLKSSLFNVTFVWQFGTCGHKFLQLFYNNVE